MCDICDTNDIISRCALKDAIEELTWYSKNKDGVLVEGASSDCDAYYKVWEIFEKIDTAQAVNSKNDVFEWCHDCKEYNKEKHYCPKFTQVIRDTVDEMKDYKLEELQPHGHWVIKGTREGTNHCECSECNHEGDRWDKFCRNCGAKIDRNWIDLTDYCPTDCDGLSDYKPIWHWRCPVCDNHIFDVEHPPEECPECHIKLYR